MGVCALCTDGKKKPLTKGMCQEHYWQQNKLKSAQKLQGKEVLDEEGLPELIEEADAVFSRFIRMSAADEEGNILCYICNESLRWQDADCMHFIDRINYFLRWDIRNCKAGCRICNRVKDGNILKFAAKLNAEQPGITDILFEESRIVYKPTREEVRTIIGETTTKLKIIQKQLT